MKINPVDSKLNAFGYETGQNKMDLDFWDCFGREKLILKQNFIRNPFQYKKGFSKVNSLFCTVKAIYGRVIFHI